MPLIEELALTNPTRISPGWALVPDTQLITALEPGKRNRGAPRDGGRIGGGITAKQLKAAEARLEKLEKENGSKEVPIAIPAGRFKERSKKMTTNVRRILTYQRNFNHYLADELAQVQAGGGGANVTLAPLQRGDARRRESGVAATLGGARRTSTQQLPMHPPPRPRSTSTANQTPATLKHEPSASSTVMPPPPSPTTAPSSTLQQPATTSDPLLKTLGLPKPPSARVMAALLAEPPLSYTAARAQVLDDSASKPARHFCGICGYWGKVRCRACGAGRTCGLLECYKAHREVCEGLLR